jgi:hypothetical protein
MAENYLSKYDAARRALAAAKTVDAVKKVRNQAEALRAYAKQAKDRTLEVDAAEIRLRAERRIGQLIVGQKATVGLAKGAAQRGVGRKGKRGFEENPHLAKIRLQDLGIDKRLAMKARQLAALSDNELEIRLAAWRADIIERNNKVTVDLLRKVKREAWEKQEAEKEASLLSDPERMRQLTGYWLAAPAAEDPESPPPLEFETYRAKLEWLLTVNPSSTKLPKTLNSAAKIVADGLWRLMLLQRAAPRLQNAAARMGLVIDIMDERLAKLGNEYASSRSG